MNITTHLKFPKCFLLLLISSKSNIQWTTLISGTQSKEKSGHANLQYLRYQDFSGPGSQTLEISKPL